MKIAIKVMNHPSVATSRVYLAEIKDAASSKQVLEEVYRGKQAVGNADKIFIRCGDDKDFYGLTSKAEIIGWVNERLKAGK